jgi:hypothetical protein
MVMPFPTGVAVITPARSISGDGYTHDPKYGRQRTACLEKGPVDAIFGKGKAAETQQEDA